MRGIRDGLALGVFLALMGTTGCSTVLFVREPQSQVFTDPVYESKRPAFFMGLSVPESAGSNDIYVDKICLGKDVDQISTEYTASDVLAGIFTLGIYTPRTVKIWCSL